MVLINYYAFKILNSLKKSFKKPKKKNTKNKKYIRNITYFLRNFSNKNLKSITIYKITHFLKLWRKLSDFWKKYFF